MEPKLPATLTFVKVILPKDLTIGKIVIKHQMLPNIQEISTSSYRWFLVFFSWHAS